MQIKTMMRYQYIYIRRAEIKRLTILSDDRNVAELELLYTAGGNAKWYRCFGK